MLAGSHLESRAALLGGSRRAWAVVVTLAMLSIVAFVDRQVLAVLVDGIERDMQIDDVALGWLLGPTFIISYNIVLIPLAFLIDARNRKRLIVIAVVLWCTMTLLSASATTYTELVLFRSGLAVGEAVLGPAAVSLIGDLFDREHRATPMAVYMVGTTIGQSGSALFGAAALQATAVMPIMLDGVGAVAPWRLTLVLVAVPGFILSWVLAVIAREPARGATVGTGSEADRKDETLIVHVRSSWRPYLLIAVFSGCVNMLAVALTLWGPAYLGRAFGQTAVASGYLIGSVALVFGVTGCLLLPVLLRRRARTRGSERAIIEIAAAAFAVAVPAVIMYGLAPSLGWALAGLAVAMTALASIFSLPSQFVQLRTPPRLRARAQSGMLFIIFIISGGIGPVLLPLVAKRLFSGTGALGLSTATLAAGAALVSVPLLIWLIRSVGQPAVQPRLRTITP